MNQIAQNFVLTSTIICRTVKNASQLPINCKCTRTETNTLFSQLLNSSHQLGLKLFTCGCTVSKTTDNRIGSTDIPVRVVTRTKNNSISFNRRTPGAPRNGLAASQLLLRLSTIS